MPFSVASRKVHLSNVMALTVSYFLHSMAARSMGKAAW